MKSADHLQVSWARSLAARLQASCCACCRKETAEHQARQSRKVAGKRVPVSRWPCSSLHCGLYVLPQTNEYCKRCLHTAAILRDLCDLKQSGPVPSPPPLSSTCQHQVQSLCPQNVLTYVSHMSGWKLQCPKKIPEGIRRLIAAATELWEIDSLRRCMHNKPR